MTMMLHGDHDIRVGQGRVIVSPMNRHFDERRLPFIVSRGGTACFVRTGPRSFHPTVGSAVSVNQVCMIMGHVSK